MYCSITFKGRKDPQDPKMVYGHEIEMYTIEQGEKNNKMQ